MTFVTITRLNVVSGLYRKGRQSSALRKQGICTHGWTQPQDPSAFHAGKPYRIVCNHCGATFASEAEHREAVRQAFDGA